MHRAGSAAAFKPCRSFATRGRTRGPGHAPAPHHPPAPDAAPIRLAELPRRPLLGVALIATLILLLLHAGRYAFLTDDAYISFRYARNLAEGHGLVFNAGAERVEGYSNFLWTALLAAASAAGVPPERAASPLSLLATVALWALVVAYALRHPPPSGHAWLIVVPPLLLALTRSVAVWSTSGLETRWFEALVVAGGVAANRRLKAALEEVAGAHGFRLVVPPPELCTDNAAMIAWAGAMRLLRGLSDDLSAPARARWALDPDAPPALGAGVKA